MIQQVAVSNAVRNCWDAAASYDDSISTRGEPSNRRLLLHARFEIDPEIGLNVGVPR